MIKDEKKLLMLFEESKREIEKVGIKLKKDITCKIGNSKRNYGLCRNKKNIEISMWLLKLDDKEIKNTIIHELLHTLDNTKGHDYRWKYYASVMNKEYGYHISRLGNIKDSLKNSNISVEEQEKIMDYKYRKTCLSCGNTQYWHRATRRKIRIYNNGLCNCYKCGKKDFKIEDIKNNIEVL